MQPELWTGADTPFVQKLVPFAPRRRRLDDLKLPDYERVDAPEVMRGSAR